MIAVPGESRGQIGGVLNLLRKGIICPRSGVKTKRRAADEAYAPFQPFLSSVRPCGKCGDKAQSLYPAKAGTQYPVTI